ncbi:MAG: serine hydrolase [Gemmatimonadetes bacterium]|nr:serine hydrolase [Gemmatimonadota bacterium]NNM04031.1 serine hydrolase [Gemmatimonadota bacterium]
MLRSFVAAAALASFAFAPGLNAQVIPLSTGSPLSGSLEAGDTVAYTVTAGDDFLVRGAVDQLSVDVIVRILHPTGRVVSSFDGPAEGPEHFQFETDAEGDWQIQVIPFEEGSGEYSIAIALLEPVATDPRELADQLLSAYDREDSPGAVVSVWRDGETIFSKAYGTANLAYGIPWVVETRTNIGSTSKQFTAFAVMLLVERGELSLDDDVREHIPELPDLGETITIRHILSHTTGYREFINLLVMTGRRVDHGDWVDRSEIIDIVQRQPALQNSPGSEFNYNNTAFGLAAAIVERISEQDFHEFMEENVFGPLGMIRTMVRPSPEHIVEGRSVGYRPGPGGIFLETGDIGGAVGAGGIYSTVGDLQRWIENYANPVVGSPGTVQEMMTPNVLTSGDTTGYGLGLFIDEHRGLRRVHHGGADMAHRSQLAYYPEINAGITTQSNHAAFDGTIAFRLAEAFFAADMEPEEEEEAPEAAAEAEAFDAEAYDPEAFDEMVGRYALEEAPAFILRFFREDDSLFGQGTGQPRFEIVPTSDSTFSFVGVQASITFHRNDDGAVSSLTLHQNGDHPANRVEGETVEWEPSAEELEAYTGRFFSEEIETFFTITLDEDHLVLKQRRLDDADLTPGEEDEFSGGGFQIAFERDRNGQVIAFYLANTRTRDIRFERVR